MEPLGDIIRADRIAQGLSLKGLATRLNQDRSLGLDREVTTSWLHHLENGRSKRLSTLVKKGIARALKQEETKYLDSDEFEAKARHTFAKFFDDQMGSFELGSTLIGDFIVDPERVEDAGELLLCLYQFLVVTEGRLVVFERSSNISLPVLLLAIRCWPEIDDCNLQEVINKILAPAAAGGFLHCSLPKPTPEALSWVTEKVEVHEPAGDEPLMALLETDSVCRLGVISPVREGFPVKRFYYYLRSREYGVLRDHLAEQAYRRLTAYRDHGLFSKCDYASSFEYAYAQMAEHYHLKFDLPRTRAPGDHPKRS